MLRLLTLLALAAGGAQSRGGGNTSSLHLLVDDAYTHSRTGLEFVMHPPKKMGLVLKPDRPWEMFIFGASVVQVSPNLFYLYYLASAGPDGTFICLATSVDAISWAKPELHLKTYHNSTANNILLGEQDPKRQGTETIAGPGSVWIDRRPGVPAAERFKMVAQGWGSPASLVEGEVTIWFSPDGIHNWTNIGKKVDTSDTCNVVFWDDNPVEGKPGFVFYGRTHIGNPHLPPSACCTGGAAANCWPPSRSVGRTYIGTDLNHWECPLETGDETCNTRDMPTIFTADALDPPCAKAPQTLPSDTALKS